MNCRTSKTKWLSRGQVFPVVLYLALAALMFAQENKNNIRFDHISSEQGLSSGVVYCILQDSRGFMWFGTQDGLIRFNGYTFEEFKKNPKDSSSLPANIVRVIYEDRFKNLWIGTEGGGLNRFNREQENFTCYRYLNDSDPDPDHNIDNIMTLHEDRDGVFWVGTLGGLLRFDPNKQTWTRFGHKPGIPGTLSDSRIRSFCQDRRGIMWIGTEEGGLNAFNPKIGEFSHFLHRPDDPDSLSNNSVYAIYEDSSGNLWVGTLEGVDRFDRQGKKFIHNRYHEEKVGSLSNNHVRAIFEDSKRRLWIGTEDGGLNLMESLSKTGEGIFIRYSYQPNNPYSLSYNNIFSIMEDNTGCIWIGTFGGGINRIAPLKQQFNHSYHDPNDSNSLSNNYVSCFCEDSEGILWIGTNEGGLNRYDPKTGNFKAYQYSSTNSESLSSNDVMAIHEDGYGVLWIGTWFGGINRFDRDNETFFHYKHIPGTNKGPASNNILCFCEDKDNRLWIGTWGGGLNLFLREKEEFRYYKNDAANPASISSNGVTAIYPDREQEELLWVGTTYSGLELFNRRSETFRHYPHKPGDPNSLSHNNVLSIYISPYNPEIIWVGTLGGGLNKFNKGTGKWQIYSEENGLSNNTIYGILEDSNKQLWMSTARGLSMFNPITQEFTNYDVDDGLQSSEFNQGGYFKSKSGRFYFGGTNGFNAFFPEKIKRNSYKPPLVITSFNVLTRKNYHREKSILETKKIVLNYKDVFSFEFAALDYTAPTKNQYAYMLEGSHDDWVKLNYKRDIIFTVVSPGSYTFRVKGSNNHGVWNEEGVSVKLIITPPFWKTWWFTVSLVFFALGMLLVMYKLRVRRYKIQRKNLETEVAKRTTKIRKQKEIIEEKNKQLEVSNRELKNSERELRELNATKDKFFSIISHDLRNHLTALLGFSDLLYRSFEKFDDRKKHRYSHSIDRSAKDLYELLENLLQWARSQTGVLQCKPRTFDLGVLIPEVISTYSINAKKKNVNLSYEIRKYTFAYADKNMVRTVLRNLISNAIKFTEIGGDIRVAANGKEGFVEVSVMDTGVGISDESRNQLFKIGKTWSTKGTAKEKGTGLGLIICKEFVEKNNGRIWFESPIPDGGDKGSVFYFTLPKSKKGIVNQ